MAYQEDIVLDDSGKTICELCNLLIDDSIEDHLEDMRHVKLFMKRLMIQNNITTVNNSQMCCGICKETLDKINIIIHIQSCHHQEKISLIIRLVSKDCGFLVLPESITNLGSVVNCLICNHTVEFNFNAINSHILSQRHRRAKSMAVQPLNAIFSVVDSKEDLWCKICKVYFENYVEIILEHVDEDPKHVKEIHKLLMLIKDQNICIERFLHDPKEDKALCKKCNISIPCNVINLGQHIRCKKHTNS